MGFWLIVLGLLMLSLLATHFFLQLRKPILGFALGAVPIILAWLALSLMAERAFYRCSRDITAICEWTGVGIFLSTLLAVALLAISAVVTAGLDVGRMLWKGEGLLEAKAPGKVRRPLWASMLLIIAVAGLGLAGGYGLSNYVTGMTAFWLTPMLALAAAIGFMAYQERKPR